ncbi:MAG: archease [Candidatus Aenigmarchaeota archaeon]|nr:archease [Candidatus Aenigmarchaeota archaeon]
MRYNYFDVTADIGVEAYGKTLEEAFENGAQAVFDLAANTATIQPEIEKEIKIESEDLESLLRDYISELLSLSEAEGIVFCKNEVKKIEQVKDYRLNSVAYGQPFNERIETKTYVKAITYYLMEIKEEDGYKLRFVLDV